MILIIVFQELHIKYFRAKGTLHATYSQVIQKKVCVCMTKNDKGCFKKKKVVICYQLGNLGIVFMGIFF